jgi:hypothetical protein
VALAGVLAGLAGAGLTGCGIPSGTGVRVDGPLPGVGSPQSGDPPTPPPGPDQADSPVELVEYFLQAAAGNPEDPLAQLRPFIHEPEQASWQPDPQVLVVRPAELVPTPDGDNQDQVRVEVEVREIGVLTDHGSIEPRDVEQLRPLTFVVVPDPEVNTEDLSLGVGGVRYRLVNPPDEILLSAQALENGFLRPRPVYFWGSDDDSLVPDLRWLPSALADAQRAQTALEWLEDGPARWLPGALVGLPDDVALAGNVVWSADRLEVPLTAAAAEVDVGRLDAQLWWTLRPELSSGRALVLTIGDQRREVDGNRYLAQNPATREKPARFAVVDGAVRQQLPGDRLELVALPEELNRDVHRAAVTWDRRFAALVRAEPDGRLRLSVARPGGLAETGLVGSVMSRPVWLAGGAAGLVVADGQLYRFSRDAETSPVRMPGDLADIQAVAAAPDGRRIAMVAGGRLYVASMAWREGSFSVNEPLVLPTTAGDLQGVGFLQENWLAFVGEEERRSQLYEITVDGALERRLPEDELGAPESVDSFTAYPGDPTSPTERGEIMYEAEGRAYRYVYPSRPVDIEAGDLHDGVPADAEPGQPRAPFFLD